MPSAAGHQERGHVGLISATHERRYGKTWMAVRDRVCFTILLLLYYSDSLHLRKKNVSSRHFPRWANKNRIKKHWFKTLSGSTPAQSRVQGLVPAGPRLPSPGSRGWTRAVDEAGQRPPLLWSGPRGLVLGQQAPLWRVLSQQCGLRVWSQGSRLLYNDLVSCGLVSAVWSQTL